MTGKAKAPVSVPALTGATNQEPSSDSSISITGFKENFTEKTAVRIFKVLAAIYAEENDLDVEVTVTRKTDKR